MAEQDPKIKELIEFLDRKIFDPIIYMSEENLKAEEKKNKFRDIQQSAQNEKNRFHTQYKTAEDIKKYYLSDLSSKIAKKKNAELEELGLPRLPEFHDDFMKLCEKLGV
jgi:hypothetical protein